jgi:membrane protease YdiL (CAAX protease family)
VAIAAIYVGLRSGRVTGPINRRGAVDVAGIQFFYIYFALRILFLVFYEFFFRGLLLLCLIDDMGHTNAVLLNIALYTLVHAFSPRREIIGTIPFGLLLCLVTIHLNSVWPAVTIHLSLAMSFEMRRVIQFIKISNTGQK